MTVFQLDAPLHFRAGQSDNIAMLPMTEALRPVQRNDRVTFGEHEFLCLKKSKEEIGFLRRQMHEPEAAKWYTPLLSWAPKFIQRRFGRKMLPVWPELVIPAGARGYVLSSSFAEGSLQPLAKK